jgi:limonene-1,2-epoxide hydrolase
MREENIETVEKFLDALRRNDLNQAPIADDLQFEDPISGKNHGAENFRSFVTGFLLALHDIKIVQHICEGEYVVTHWEAEGIFGTVTVLEKFRIENGKITEVFGIFDPRPILGSS